MAKVSSHAVDRASLRVLDQWQLTRRSGEGLHTWLARMTNEAIEKGSRGVRGRIQYAGMEFVIVDDEDPPLLKTVLPRK